MQDVIFREFEEKDTKEVSSFLRKVFGELGWTVEEKDLLDNPKKCFYESGGLFIVGEESGKIMSTAGFIPLTTTTILLKRFYVDSAYRGQGIAQQLLQYVLQTLKSRGCQTLYLDVDKDNPRAIRFYEKEGFEKCTVKPNSKWWESEEPEKHYFYKKHV